MKAFLSIFILAVVLGFVQIAEARTNQEVKLQINNQKSINKNDLTVKFVAVLEDSRCAEGANCIWAGNAKVQLKLKQKNGAWKTVELNTNIEKQEVSFGGYTIKIAELTPTPKQNIRINRNGYVATLSVNKNGK